MALTFTGTAAARDANWSIVLTIEGSGNNTGLFRYCTQRPTYADAQYREWIMDWPEISGERIDVFGGLPTAGELEVQILDYGDALTSEWRIEADPRTFLNGAINSTTTSIIVESNTGIVDDVSVLYIGNEALRVTNIAGTTITCTRGWLDTDPTPHVDNAPIHLYLPYLGARRARLYIVPVDATSAAQETSFGDYFIDTEEMTGDLNGFILRGKSQLKWLGRNIVRATPYVHEIDTYRTIDLSSHAINQTPFGSITSFDGSSRNYIKISTGEIITVSNLLQIFDRGALGTQVQEIKVGDMYTVVYGAATAEPSGRPPSWFRWSVSNSATRSSGWTRSANWIDIILNLLLSSADTSDGFELANRNTTYGSWDCLPVGIGIGIPHAQLDWPSFMAVRSRTPDYMFQNFYVGDESVPFGDLITDHFLKPIGAYLSTVGGVAKIILPRTPLIGSSVLSFGAADTLARLVADRHYTTTLRAHRRLTDVATSVIFKLADESTLTINNSDFGRGAGAGYGQPGYYAHEDKTLSIDAPSVRLDSDGLSDLLFESGMRRLVRRRRPLIDLNIPNDISHYTLAVGEIFAFTHEDLPDRSTGTRGVTDLVCELNERKLDVSPETGLTLDWTASSFGAGRFGRIAPCARVASVVASGANREITVDANRYTDSDAADGLPVTDAGAFTVNDVVQIRTRDDVLVTATTQIVTVIAGNVITVDGNFGGSLAVGAGNAGQVLSYTERATAVAAQFNSFVYWADQVGLTVGASTDVPWKYSEP